VRLSEELILACDEHGNPDGVVEKNDAHVPPGVWHFAVSVCVIDPGGRHLVQRRSGGKYHFGGLLSNSSCTHQRLGERVTDAALRCLNHELGIDAVESLCLTSTFSYEATDPVSGLCEREFDSVLVARGVDRRAIAPNLREVDEVMWLEAEELHRMRQHQPHRLTPWFAYILDALAKPSRSKD